MALIMKYTASVYQQKIDTFDSLNSTLLEHLQSLKEYRDKIPTIWEDDRTERYMTALTNSIIRVQNASNHVKGLSTEYRKIINEQNRVGAAVDDVVETVVTASEKVIDITTDVVGAAASIAPLV